MLSIENLKLHLPQGMEGRASNIARMVSEFLSTQVFESSANFNQLKINSLLISPEETDSLVAQKIASEIAIQIRSQV